MPKIIFVIDKKLDVVNHLIGLNAYKRNKERNFQQNKNETYEKYLLLNDEIKIKAEIEKSIQPIYEKKYQLDSLAEDINNAWVKIEGAFIKKLEEVHKKPFVFEQIKGVLSSSFRFGYKIDQNWFATDMLRNKFAAIDTATHELMHFMFHKYYDQTCKDKGLDKNKMWDIKEAFTVLLNLEFSEFRFQPDFGYAPHKELREVIKKSWLEHEDFAIALEDGISFLSK